MPPDLALSSTLISSNYPCLELIFMVPKVFEPLKFDCIFTFTVFCIVLVSKQSKPRSKAASALFALFPQTDLISNTMGFPLFVPGHDNTICFFLFLFHQGALSGLIVSAVLTFWVGIGGTVILPVPEVQRVSTAMCENFNRTCPSDLVNDLFNETTSTTTTTIATTTAATVPPEQNL